MSNLLDKASIILTPTAYNNGEALCVKPSDGSGDFDFSRNSAATRVNAQGLVENVQILSSNLVQNGDFSEEGVQEVSNGSFSQEGSELITNGDFSNGSTGWSKSTQVTIENGVANIISNDGSFQVLVQNNITTIGKSYVLTYTIVSNNDGGLKLGNIGEINSAIGTHSFYFVATETPINIARNSGITDISIDNISVREVGQDWTLGTGVSIGENKAVFTSTPSGQSVSQNAVASQIPNGTSVKVSFEVLSISSGSFGVYFSGSLVGSLNSVGVATFYFEKGTETSFYIRALGTTTGSITNISVKEVGQNWNLGYNWSIGNGVAICNVSSSFLSQGNILLSNKKYKISFEITEYISGEIRAVSDGYLNTSEYFNSLGVHDFIFNCGTLTSSTLFFQPASFNGSITNISVIEITTDTSLPRINYEGFSYQDALGSEEVVNGTFDSDTAWSKGAGWSIANGEATHTGSASYLSQSILNPNTQYKVKIKVSQASGSNFVQIYMGGSPASVLIQNVGEYEYIFTSQPSIGLGFALRGAGNVTIDNVSVKEYLGQEVVPDSGCGSWLFESQSTNLVTDSEDYSQWTPTGVSVTSNSTTSPDGLINGTLLSTNGGTSSRLIRNYGLPTSATIKVLSIYAKANLSNFIQLLLNGDAQSYVNFDVSNGVVGTSGTKTTGEIQSVGNGWYRCIAYFDSTTIFGASSFVALTISNSVGYSGYATSDDLNVYIWGSQYEENNISSYIPTSGSTVTRNQDLCTNGGSLATINSTEGTLYFEGKRLSLLGSKRTISISDGSLNNYLYIQFQGVSNTIRIFYKTAETGQVLLLNYNSTNPIEFGKYAFKWSDANFSLWVNGIKELEQLTGSTATSNVFNTIDFSLGNGADKFFGKTKALAVWKEALSDAELTELTTI